MTLLTTIVLDSGGVSAFADGRNIAKVRALLELGAWPPAVPSVVLAECTTGLARDANTNRFLKQCVIHHQVSTAVGRHAGFLRHRAGTGSGIDALVVAFAAALGGATIVTSDVHDLTALASRALNVTIRGV